MSVGYAIVDRWDERERASDEAAAADGGIAIPFPHLLPFAPCDQKNK